MVSPLLLQNYTKGGTIMAQYRQNADWREEDHPRDANGKFSSKTATSTNASQKNSINIQLFAAKLSEQSVKELKKSKNSTEERLREHQYKLEHPDEFISNWAEMSDIEKAGRLNWWRKEIKTFQTTIERINALLETKKDED